MQCACAVEPYICFCDLPGSITFFHNMSYTVWFLGRIIEYKMCVLSSSTNLSETFLILRRIQLDIIMNVRRSSCEVPVILERFQWNLNFVDRYSTKFRYQISLKSIPLEPNCSIRTDGHGETMKLWSFTILQTPQKTVFQEYEIFQGTPLEN